MAGYTQYIVAAVAVLLSVILYYIKFHRLKQFFNKFPHPPGLPLIGNALDFKTPGEFLKKLHEYTKQHGGMFRLKFSVRDVLVVSDPKFLEFLLSHNKLLKKGYNLISLEPWIGKGLVTADGGPKWKIHRKLITPAFHFKILEQFVDTFEIKGDVLVEKLSLESGNKSVDIYPYITKCALEIISETAMGTKLNIQNAETSAYFESVKHMCKMLPVRTMSVLQRYDFFFQMTENYQKQKKAIEILHGYTEKVIQEKRKILAEKRKNQDNTEEVDEFGRKKKKVFLDLILEATVDDKSLSDDEIREEVDTFMFAGHDTTATSSAFVLHCIANHKEVQDKIIEEQEQLFGDDKNPKVTYTNLQEMKYLENVIKETMRVFTPVSIYGRLIDQDVEYDGMTIPAGVGVMIFSAGLHMNPKLYPNPEKFDPTRFESTENRQNFAYIPFSAGPRNCIGQKYAMLEIKSLVSKIVRNFELSPAYPHHELDLSPETVLKSLNGVKIGIQKRK